MTKVNISKAYLAAFLLYIATGPYYVWPLLRVQHASAIIGVVISVIFYTEVRRLSKRDSVLMMLFLLTLLIFSFSLPMPIFGLAFVPLIFLFFSKNDFAKLVYRHYETIFAFLMIPALVSWNLAIFKIISPISIIEPLVVAKDYIYYVYPFCVEAGYESIRFCGPFDEPGVVGTSTAIMLCIRGFKLNNWKTIVLLISGLYSLSFFFFLIAIIYGFSFSIARKNYSGLLLIPVLVGGLYFQTRDDNVFYISLWHRFEWNSEEGKLEGDTRQSEAADAYYASKRFSSGYWFGLSTAEQEHYNRIASGSSSYKGVVLAYGMIFFILYMVFFILIALWNSKKRSDIIFYLIIFLGTLYQRTNIYDSVTMFLFYVMARKDMFIERSDMA